VDSTDVGVLEFDLTTADKNILYDVGYTAGLQFLATWDWSEYVEQFR